MQNVKNKKKLKISKNFKFIKLQPCEIINYKNINDKIFRLLENNGGAKYKKKITIEISFRLIKMTTV